MTEGTRGGRTAEQMGARKAAIFITSIPKDSAARLLSQFETTDQKRVALEIARLEQEPPGRAERDGVLKEFYHIHLAQQYVEHGGVEYARQTLGKILPADQVGRILEVIEGSLDSAPFGFLQRADSENLVSFIADEHPQTIALILTYLGSNQAAGILEGLPIEKQQEVVRRLATMEHTSPEVVQEVESALQNKLSAYITQDLRKTGGVATAAEILNLVHRSTERTILESLEGDDPDMVEQIRHLMFTFEDILRVNDKGVQNLIKEIDTPQLLLAMKTATLELKDMIFRNMSDRAADMLKEEIEFLGPVRLSDVEAAQQAIVDVVRRLEEQGELIVEGRAGGEGIVE